MSDKEINSYKCNGCDNGDGDKEFQPCIVVSVQFGKTKPTQCPYGFSRDMNWE
jgi:hypothetical protein